MYHVVEPGGKILYSSDDVQAAALHLIQLLDTHPGCVIRTDTEFIGFGDLHKPKNTDL